MKRIIIVLFALFCFVGVKEMNAQKFGHVNFDAIYDQTPGRDAVEAEFEKYVMDIRKQLEAMAIEIKQKESEYATNSASMTSLIRTAKENELRDLYMRYEEFQNSANTDVSDKRTELMEPLIEKAKQAVEDVAKEHGYTYIFNSSGLLLLYATPSDDIMDLVLKKLGVK